MKPTYLEGLTAEGLTACHIGEPVRGRSLRTLCGRPRYEYDARSNRIGSICTTCKEISAEIKAWAEQVEAAVQGGKP